MNKKTERASGSIKLAIVSAIIIFLIAVIVGCAMLYGVKDDLFDDPLESSMKFGKIAVAADGKSLNSNVSPMFGRAKYFIIVDPNTGEYKTIRNPYRNLGGGSGIQAAQLIAKEIEEGVITGNIGPNAYKSLDGMGLNVYTGYTGTAGKAVEQFKNDRLAAVQSYSVPQFYGREKLAVDVLDYYHCPNCNTVVPCPYSHNGIERPCPSCGLKMNIVSKNRAAVQNSAWLNVNNANSFGLGIGPGGNLVCPGCGTVVPHQRGVPAYTVNCPNCGTPMYRQLPANTPTAFYNNMTESQIVQQKNQPLAPPITSQAPLSHEFKGVCSNCHLIADPVTYSDFLRQAGGNSLNGTRPYRIGPGGCIIY